MSCVPEDTSVTRPYQPGVSLNRNNVMGFMIALSTMTNVSVVTWVLTKTKMEITI